MLSNCAKYGDPSYKKYKKLPPMALEMRGTGGTVLVLRDVPRGRAEEMRGARTPLALEYSCSTDWF